MNSKVSKWMALPGARLTQVGMLSLVMNESLGDGTIGTSIGKVRRKSPYMARQLLVFFCTGKI
jgi:hypothetical protein